MYICHTFWCHTHFPGRELPLVLLAGFPPTQGQCCHVGLPLATSCKPGVPIHVSVVNKCIAHPCRGQGEKDMSLPA